MASRTPADVTLRRLGSEDAAVFHAVRLAALERHPHSYATSADAWSRFDADGVRPLLERADRELVIGVSDAAHASRGDPAEASSPGNFVAPLIGMAGVKRQARDAVRHVGTLWGVYVEDAWRRRGVGGALVARALDEAARSLDGLEQVRLMVPASGEAAIGLFEQQGFERYGLEVRARRYGDVYEDQVYMVRFL